MAFFDLCAENKLGYSNKPARECLYVEIPEYFTWNAKNTDEPWKQRKRLAGKVIGRMYSVSPRDEERFYMRMLLCHRRGPTSFVDMRTVDGHVKDTSEEAAAARARPRCISNFATTRRVPRTSCSAEPRVRQPLDCHGTFPEASRWTRGHSLPNNPSS